MSTMDNEPKVIANAPCCVCGGTASTPFFDRRFDKFNYAGEFHMRRCDGCGLLFCSPRLTDAGIAALYDANYYVFQKDDGGYFARTAEIFQRTVGLLPDDVPRTAVEIGSGKGYLLGVLKQLGWTVQGIEIAADAAAHGERVFGVPAHAGTLESWLARPVAERDTFAVVLCIDIIEHVLDPDRFVAGLAQVTAPDGHVIIDTPNGNARHIEIEGSQWRGFNPFHIYSFADAHMRRLLERHGFEVIRSFTYNNTVDRKPAPAGLGARLRRLVTGGADGASRPAPTDLASCVEACRTAPPWFTTRDAKAELAGELRGENLVVIARRIR